MRYVSGTKLDERIIRCDLDLGYKEGRQFGRGKSGGQVRDEHRQDYDPGRGGWGAQMQKLEIERRREMEERYADAQDGPGAVAGGGGEWAQVHALPEGNKLKRGRSPEDEADGDGEPMVSFAAYLVEQGLIMVSTGCSNSDGRPGWRPNVTLLSTRSLFSSQQILDSHCIIRVLLNELHLNNVLPLPWQLRSVKFAVYIKSVFPGLHDHEEL